jgi:hypothetical protein
MFGSMLFAYKYATFFGYASNIIEVHIFSVLAFFIFSFFSFRFSFHSFIIYFIYLVCLSFLIRKLQYGSRKNVKFWRLFADLINDIGYFLPILGCIYLLLIFHFMFLFFV